ncbi:uncharacterized protein BCR38DRAFT_420576 [Pseudomassariella vexata]|uniref:Pentatricopeptide repeat domain-containing protein n=1 Tax=Pseudomassariella vexata TaxID=1141098 RepID=A0A1Y2EEF8_9PEZI|nr:uncharacterized protein BCR38DRAFT_420576 [Pseudomassariella vexata]ORY69963.1 hypothetical protein BCR38DRAFT_420576 [Pseudomassariella vexata]
MFACRACTRRCLTILFENTILLEVPKYAAPTAACTAKSYATAAVAMRPSRPARSSKPAEDEQEDQDEDGDEDDVKRRVSKSTQWAVNKHLHYLKDPLFIAQHVEQTLAKGRFDEAALLVRTASKDHKIPVSWNHLIDYQLREHKLHAAMKLYNEMKKRAQMPTAQTYTIIFRGCAASPHSKLAVREAVRLYNNMLNGPDERLKPNTIHLNAVLQVCARANDIDTMFTIVDSANGGLRAPNNLTYTTILNALRNHAVQAIHESSKRGPDGASESQLEEIAQLSIQRAKAIWDEVISKWRSANIVIDEELVCSMGRILLLGGYKDSEAVLSLIEQTMKIPKDEQLLIRLGMDREASATQVQEVQNSKSKALQKPSYKAPRKLSATHAQPGNNSLSLILSVLDKIRKTTLGPRYWTVFTKVYSVDPDAQNWHALLRLLCRGKNSTKTVEYLLQTMPKEYMSARTFRTAMFTCLGDNLNKSAFNNATSVLEIMLTTMRVPDMRAMSIYLRLAYANKRMFVEQAKTDVDGAKLAWGKQLTTALDNLWEPYKIAAKQFTFGGLAKVPHKRFLNETERERWLHDAGPRADLVALARKMIAAHDRLIFEGIVPTDVAERLKPNRNLLNRFVVKYFEDRERLEPGWNRKLKELEAQEEEDDKYKWVAFYEREQ